MNREELLSYVQEHYDVRPDFPWTRYPELAVLRRGDKWFALLMEVGRARLGLPGEGALALVNLKCDPLLIGSLRGTPGIVLRLFCARTSLRNLEIHKVFLRFRA